MQPREEVTVKRWYHKIFCPHGFQVAEHPLQGECKIDVGWPAETPCSVLNLGGGISERAPKTCAFRIHSGYINMQNAKFIFEEAVRSSVNQSSVGQQEGKVARDSLCECRGCFPLYGLKSLTTRVMNNTSLCYDTLFVLLLMATMVFHSVSTLPSVCAYITTKEMKC